eukprot:TRINITY_DN7556_c0_g1_i1.p1 TRINITY_DN7556_c0_g1~~TRINITY_DN7556_c0_g1_i1.p1  ORF type:complete len:216 (-),score=63.31 TRINITY_DN7556_c0_g1_i1:565-1212(-)
MSSDIAARLSDLEKAISQDRAAFPAFFSVSSSSSSSLSSSSSSSSSSLSTTSHQPISVSQKLSELYTKWNKISTVAPFRDFFAKYESLSSSLEQEGVDMRILLLTNEMKKTLLLSGWKDFVTTAQQLETVDKSRSIFDKWPTDSLVKLKERLPEMEVKSQQKYDLALKTHQKVEQLLDTYNEMVNLLSRRVLDWDAELSRYEYIINQQQQKDVSS